MRPINIYALTRIEKKTDLQRLERQMSGRSRFLLIKKWELDTLKLLIRHLQDHMANAEQLFFYYSFQIPKLGKEFDLLRINADTVINIELKSGEVSDESILKQLKQNRYYLASLGKTMRSYTYISSCDRLVRLTGSGKIVDTEWEYLCADLQKQTACYGKDAEDLFKAENYIISPLAEPERFLQKEYFLTSQQRDIERRILKRIREEGYCAQGFTGLPGTGKSLLLYDLAMRLSANRRVCILHCGSCTREFSQLNERLKRIDMYQESETDVLVTKTYAAVLIDESHRISKEHLDTITAYTEATRAPVIFSYDFEDMISNQEMDKDIIRTIEGLPNYTAYRLTNRIRTNAELSSFIQSVMHPVGYVHKKEYSGVSVAFANDEDELGALLRNYSGLGYVHIYHDTGQSESPNESMNEPCRIPISKADCREFDKVVMVMDTSLYYDDDHYLRSQISAPSGHSTVRNLFQGLNRAKTGLALIVYQNEPVFDELLNILQGQ